MQVGGGLATINTLQVDSTSNLSLLNVSGSTNLSSLNVSGSSSLQNATINRLNANGFTIDIESSTTFLASDFRINQIVDFGGGAEANQTITLPAPGTCINQVLYIWNYSSYPVIISMNSQGGRFYSFNGGGITSFSLPPQGMCNFVSEATHWLLMNRNISPVSGQTLQKKIFSSGTGASLINSSIPSNVQKQIYEYTLTPLSSNSTIFSSFDCNYSIGGSGNDSWQSYIQNTVGSNNSPTFAYRTMIFNEDNRNCSVGLFPLKGAISNTSLGLRPIQVWAGSLSSDDTLTIDTTNLCFTIEEIQN